MTIQTVPLSSLRPPAANPRTAFDAQTLEGLAASIRTDGLLQNLVVVPGGKRGAGKGTYRIVSGERRYRAMMLLAERGELAADHEVPVEIRDDLDKDDVLRLATVENLQREDLPPLDQAAALAALIRKGTTLDDIVSRTGLSPATIKRRLALSGLCPEARAALLDRTITLAQAEALTLGPAEAQASIVLEITQGHAVSADDIRAHFLDDRPSVAMAIFPRERYTGSVTTDLFGAAEDSYFDDAEQFMTLQRAAVEELAERHRESAAWVDVTDCHRPPTWQYDEPGEGQPTGVLINLSPSGHVTVHEGLAKSVDLDEDTASQTREAPDAAPARKTVYATPLRRLIAWHKTMAVQELLLANPRKAREVLAVALLTRLRPHDAVRQFEKHPEPQTAWKTVDGCAALCAKRLGSDPGDASGVAALTTDRHTHVEVWRAVRDLSDAHLDQLLTLLAVLPFGQENCDRLDSGQSLFNAVAMDLAADMHNHWRPDADFLNRRTRDQLLGLAADCGFAEGRSGLHTWKKAELIAALLRHFEQARTASTPTEAQLLARAWLPEAMAFPAIDPDATSPGDDESLADDDDHSGAEYADA
jgi:ParB family chromosome partitioning protein